MYNNYANDPSVAILGTLFAYLGIILLITLIISIIMMISWWKVFKKFNKPGWYSLIPILNIWTLLEIVNLPGWWCFLPFANFIFIIVAFVKIAKIYGKGNLFIVGLVLLPFIFFPILAFSKNRKENYENLTVAYPHQNTQFNNFQNISQDDTNDSNIQYKYCPNCGNKITSDSQICFMCGSKIK